MAGIGSYVCFHCGAPFNSLQSIRAHLKWCEAYLASKGKTREDVRRKDRESRQKRKQAQQNIERGIPYYACVFCGRTRWNTGICSCGGSEWEEFFT